MWRCAVSSLYKSVFKLILCSSFYLFPAILLTQQQEVEVLVIKAVGDVMLGSITPKTILPPNYEVFDGIREYLSSADVVLCNLEGMFITKDIKAAKHKLHKPHNYYFGTPVEFAVILKKLNFNVVSLNNNHIMDYGMAAYKLTQQTLTQLGLHCATNQKYATLEIKNTKIAVVAFSFTDTNYSILNISDAKNKITKIKQQHDIVIVSFHGGAEGEEALYVKNSTEYFLGENRGNVVEFAHSVIDAGADLVIGHGPHVLRAVEVYKNKLIAYSLGNFLTYGNFNLEGQRKYSGILEVYLTTKGEFIKANFIPIVQKYPGVPVYDKQKAAIKLLNSLGEKNFPQTYYKFD